MVALDALSLPTIGAIVVLLVAVVSLWAGRRPWLIALGACVAGGLVTGILHGPAIAWLAAIAIGARFTAVSAGWRRAGWLALTALVWIGLALHWLPGFSNPILLRDVVLADGARPYSLYANFDKTLAGALLLGAGGWSPMGSARAWLTAFRRAGPVLLVTVVVAMAAALALGFVRFDPRWTPLFPLWAAVNLLTTCVSEEAFFRGLVLREATRLAPPHARWTAVAVSALTFGLAHLAGGWTYVLLAGLAGTGYAVACERTGRIEMSILTHFAVNALHFLLFTYPALA